MSTVGWSWFLESCFGAAAVQVSLKLVGLLVIASTSHWTRRRSKRLLSDHEFCEFRLFSLAFGVGYFCPSVNIIIITDRLWWDSRSLWLWTTVLCGQVSWANDLALLRFNVELNYDLWSRISGTPSSLDSPSPHGGSWFMESISVTVSHAARSLSMLGGNLHH